MRTEAEHKRMEIVYLPLGDIKPYWRNPRDNESAVDPVVSSVDQYDFNVPLVIDTDHVIITGHSRYRALIAMGWTMVPCIIRDLPAKKAKAFRMVDNKTGEFAQWKPDWMVAELRELGTPEELQIFFPDLNLSDLMLQSAGGEFTEPTDEQIESLGRRMGTAMETAAEKRESALVEVTCPHCGDTFHVDRNQLQNAVNPGEEADAQ